MTESARCCRTASSAVSMRSVEQFWGDIHFAEELAHLIPQNGLRCLGIGAQVQADGQFHGRQFAPFDWGQPDHRMLQQVAAARASGQDQGLGFLQHSHPDGPDRRAERADERAN